MLKELMIHKTVLRLSAFISRNASCWHCCTVITLSAWRRREEMGVLCVLPQIYVHLHTEQLGQRGAEPGQ